jgi:hypothetical protein
VGLWHYYNGEHVDLSKVHDEAQMRMNDRVDPWSSVIHDHPFEEPCKDKIHYIYDGGITQRQLDGLPASLANKTEVVNKEPMGNGLRR